MTHPGNAAFIRVRLLAYFSRGRRHRRTMRWKF